MKHKSLVTLIVCLGLAAALVAGQANSQPGDQPDRQPGPQGQCDRSRGGGPNGPNCQNMPGPGMDDGMPFMAHITWWRIADITDQLNLTAQQKDQLSALEDELMRFQIQNSADLHIALLDLKAALSAEPISDSKVNEITTRIVDLRGAQIKKMIDIQVRSLKALTADQRAKLRAILDSRPMPFGQPRGEHGRNQDAPRGQGGSQQGNNR